MFKITGILIVIIITSGAGWFIYNDINKGNSSENDVDDNLIAASVDNIPQDIKDIVIENNIIKINLAVPNLSKQIIFYNNDLPEDAKILLREKITKLRNNLKENNDLFLDWLSLGVNYKIAGDYESARDAWEYASVIRPSSSVSFSNLGDLYHYYLKDFPKAEKNFLQAIENDKQKTDVYIALHELYKYSYKQNTTLVTDVLFEGLKEEPKNTNLLIILAAYFKEIEDIANAKKYYTQARDEAQKLENTQLIELLNKEIKEISKP